jgi:hypothetical protein
MFGFKYLFQMNSRKLGKFNIGITAGIETDLCDVRFIQGANNMDLILGSSKS